MKIVIILCLVLFNVNTFSQQTDSLARATSSVEKTLDEVNNSNSDSVSSNIIFFDDFNNNKNNWTVANNKDESARIENGYYYLTANGHAYGEAQEVKIDTQKDFEIEAKIKILSGESDHKNYYSMLFWGREGMEGNYFTFAKDGFVSVEKCDGKNQSDCITKSGSLQKSDLKPDEFNLYQLKRTGKVYSFFINGKQFYEMPFAPFFGDLIGFGAGRKVTLVIDYIKVKYL
jgi:hypothetical protein